MKQITPFRIFDAAAGSGKTFTLVKEYLKIILSENNESYYKHLLAITFTNKAVSEMKQRIISNLVFFSKEDFLKDPSDMGKIIGAEINFSFEQINKQSKKIIKHLLHHYSHFSVETIDHFNHRLIRTFARDLKLSGNFEVNLDVQKLVNEAVDQLISKAGEDPKTTKVLLDFALEKTNDDRSWDISKDIAKISQLIYKETEVASISKLKTKTLDDFLAFNTKLKKKKQLYTDQIKEIANETLLLIEEAGLQFDDFSGSYLPKHFHHLSNENFKINYEAKWQLTIGEKPLYPKRVSDDVASTIDDLTPTFSTNFERTKSLVYKLFLYDSMLKNNTPLSVINLVIKEIETIKEESNMLPISEFNSLINKEIKNQPAPFIYERLGERYRHFFIDEFQDTSYLQWHNLIPLIDNALSQEYVDTNAGSLLLVGDAKQSIYRWRGGFPEQFIDLSNKISPFNIENIEVENLQTNYRSRKEIIQFNNTFFSFIADFLGDENHVQLYKEGNKQETNSKEGGYINLNFIQVEDKEESHLLNAQKVTEIIANLLNNGYEKNDICILTRKKKDGILLGSYLLENNIPIVSSETLLLKHSVIVNAIVNAIILSIHFDNDEVKVEFLDFLYHHFSISEEKHTFFEALVNLSEEEFYTALENFGIHFNFQIFQTQSLYQNCEYCIRQLQLDEKADAYLFGFLDFVFEFEKGYQASKTSFLETWETKKETEGIASNNSDAIQLMTIHKAKGLEFPVVIFPYANVNIYNEIEPKTWYPLDNEEFGFEESLINFNADVARFGEAGAKIYSERRNTLELDNFNLLYVTLTRAAEQLYIVSEVPKPIKEGKPSSYSQLFGAYLQDIGVWDENTLKYEFGIFEKAHKKDTSEEFIEIESKLIATEPTSHKIHLVTKEASLWKTDAEVAINIGALLHDTMEKIKYEDDVDNAISEIKKQEVLSNKEAILLKDKVFSIIHHPELVRFYKTEDEVVNERDIISQGDILRPDRLNFHNDNEVTIIDYKTGAVNTKNQAQIESYASALKDMGYKVVEKILIYVSNQQISINKV